VLVKHALRKEFIIQAFFCNKCGKRMDNADFIGQIAQLAFALIIFAKIILFMTIGSYLGFEASLYSVSIGILVAVGFRIWFRFYSWKSFPRIKSIDEKSVVIKTPGKGKLRHNRIVASF
jgi:protein-S-isoprenylcysteine O-methyltransferase Ste14